MEQSVQYVKGLDLSYLVKRLVTKENWIEDEAQEAVRKYKNFLILACKYPDRIAFVPTEEIDAVWHAHILHTRNYMHDCDQILGKYLHHKPSSGSKEDQERLKNGYIKTAQLYVEEFNELYSTALEISSFF